MDFLAHIIWSILIFGKFMPLGELVQVAVFSVLPDIIWGLPGMLYYAWAFLSKKRLPLGNRGFPKPKPWMERLYNFGHSFAIMFLFFGILSLIFSQLFIPLLLGWGLHLLIDILIHKDSVFHQKPLYPLSNIKVRGYIWHGQKKFVIINWTLIIIIALLYAFRVL